MKTVLEMAREAGMVYRELEDEFANANTDGIDIETLERFHTLTHNATLDEIADKIGKMPFGDTAASFAVWIREQKT